MFGVRRVRDDRVVAKEVFLSHSYRDTENKDLLLCALPPNVEPFFFPPITVTPDQMVSNDLILSILDCEAVVYIDGGLSAQSFWVAFERDFAKRAKLHVFEFNPVMTMISPYESPPLHLPVFPSYTSRDRSRVDRIFWPACGTSGSLISSFDREDLQPGAQWAEELGHAMSSRLRAGGYVEHSCRQQPQHRRGSAGSAGQLAGVRRSGYLCLADSPQSLPPEFPVPETQWVVLHRSDDESRLNWNEIDRLIGLH